MVRNGSFVLPKVIIKLLMSAQQSLHQPLQQNSAFQIYLRELDAHSLAGDNVSHDSFCAYVPVGDFKSQSQFRAYRRRIGHSDEQASHAYRPDARKKLQVAAMPSYEHALRQ
jgi:hypothetical protein